MIFSSSREVGVFQDDLEQRAFLVAELGHLEEFHLHVLKLAGEQLGDGDHHVDFAGAAAQQVARFVEFGGGVLGAVRETADGARPDAAALQGADRQIDIAGPHAGAGDVVPLGEFQAFDYLFIGEFGFDQRVVDQFGEGFDGSERGHPHFLRLAGAAAVPAPTAVQAEALRSVHAWTAWSLLG